MEITDVRIRKIDSEGKMKAVVSVTFDNEFVVHDIKVIESQNGLFIAMPSRKAPDGEFRDIAHPINAETKARFRLPFWINMSRFAQAVPKRKEITKNC